MPPEVIQAGMPSIDMRRTAINEHCPAYLKKPRCSVKRFREYNGMCNNLDNPHWGATLAPFRRLIPAAYGDGKFYEMPTLLIELTVAKITTFFFISRYEFAISRLNQGSLAKNSLFRNSQVVTMQNNFCIFELCVALLKITYDDC